jgi:hypothetical protein
MRKKIINIFYILMMIKLSGTNDLDERKAIRNRLLAVKEQKSSKSAAV